ncbi:molybdenum cofactor guanylyltransferase MobA [Enterovirga aerilata]|uniref:Molybdenum cofactor guanylyltransferase n=1 Tax=Enterovirga aerilata TaxID=2730920 RepID=A0A849I894_9HYPH|nr:molybdenum cofactor guanylyltransferase MobA [Enterovirga sp. DB1703]NNM72227.1 molybdenum cofactor guanylyltransferase MobA [Enterovirga sp. DB1703]
MTTHPDTLGVVLAGGLARRMGGGDKGLSLIEGRTILERLVERLGRQCAGVILNANGDPERFASFGLPVVPDSVPGFAGPLAGVLAGLDWAAAHRPDLGWIATAAADTPFLPQDFVARLHAARSAAGSPLASAASGGRTHPVNGLWPVALRDDLRRALVQEGERKVGRWTARHGAATAEWSGSPDPFFNVNAPEDLEEARRLAAGRAQ